MLGKIKEILEITNVELHGAGHLNGQGGARLGVASMLSSLGGFGGMDGFKVTTDLHTFYVLIDNGQSCCEDWGYFSSEDDSAPFVGAELQEVRLTDMALNQKAVEESAPYGFDEGGIQFVDFVTDKGTFQLAVYNAHNGYYGHGILILKDEEVILNDTL